MSNKFYGPLFKFSRLLVSIFHRKFNIDRVETKGAPVVYVSHHQNLLGPFVTLLSFPIDLHCWILHVFMDRAACFKHYAKYTFSQRFGWPKWVANTLGFLASLYIPALLNSGKHIPVYRGNRKILQSFKDSVDVLKKNESVVIFPDVDYSDSSDSVGELYEGFLYIEKYFYKETGQHVCFIPLYASKKKKEMVTGKPIFFRDGEPFLQERKVVLEEIQNELNRLAED